MKRNEINLYLLPQEDVCDMLSKTDGNNLSAIHLGSPVVLGLFCSLLYPQYLEPCDPWNTPSKYLLNE